MADIRVNPDELDRLAGEFQNASQQTQEMVSRLRNAISGVQNTWEGMASKRFFSDYQQWDGQMRRYVELLTSISRDLKNIAENFRRADQ
ncbi:WXG100 family type VII secretion target [Fonticella tunisiensis]|uniref:WXG100 family type VII secretion target n=1 Tax=Fonticella tunisiensis TaxID=1096341 RepID=A0A4V6Q2T6_9CLOT|nr:WXG100 family type VII secretion target [Fonticella tunisiensis]TDT51990.1 WXG100 family type VII secretion target [Fonticella tunisiensis]